MKSVQQLTLSGVLPPAIGRKPVQNRASS